MTNVELIMAEAPVAKVRVPKEKRKRDRDERKRERVKVQRAMNPRRMR
jgi:hypothetical protein